MPLLSIQKEPSRTSISRTGLVVADVYFSPIKLFLFICLFIQQNKLYALQPSLGPHIADSMAPHHNHVARSTRYWEAFDNGLSGIFLVRLRQEHMPALDVFSSRSR